MQDVLILLGLVAAFVVLNRWILPKLGLRG